MYQILMDDEVFTLMSKKITEFITLYKTNKINLNKVSPSVNPGDILNKLTKIKNESEDFNIIFNDFKKIIFPNILNWQHPFFLGYFPSCNSYPSILGELLSAGLGIIGFSWSASPSSTELEMFCINEFIRIMKLPFKNGVILNTSSESILISMLCSKNKYKNNENLIMYTSELSHSCVFKNAKLLNINLKSIKYDNNFSLDVNILKENIINDIKNGLTPFYILATFGTTSLLSFDNIYEIGKICKEYNIYLHVDGAYSGCAIICKKYRKLLKGIEYVDSFNFNPNKLLLINFDCTFLFFNDKNLYYNHLSIDPSYLTSENNKIDFRNYDISLSRRFRSLKIWFTLRSYGIKKIQKYIKKKFKLAKILKHILINNDKRINIINNVIMGLVCFRINNDNILTEKVYNYINNENIMYITSSIVSDMYIIRISINNINSKDILYQIQKYISFVIDKFCNR